MGNGQNSSERRGIDRVQFHRAVELKFTKFQDFLTVIAGNISPGGMFIETDLPHQPGEQFEFRCELADGFPLVGGRAEVVWARQRSSEPGEPRGMGVRFVELFDESEALIKRIVEERLKAGEGTFDLEREGASETESRAATLTPGIGTLIDEEIEAATGRLVEVGADSTADLETADEPGPEPEPDPEAEPELEADREPDQEPEPESAPESSTPELPPVEAIDSAPTRAESPLAFAQQPEPPATTPAPAPRAPKIELPPDLPAAREPTDAPGLDAQAASGVARVASARRRLGIRRILELVVLSLVVGFGVLLAFNQYYVRPRIERLESRLGELTGNSMVGGPPGVRRAQRSAEANAAADPSGDGEGSERPGGVASSGLANSDKPAGAAEAPAEIAPPAAVDVRDIVRSWAAAWSGQQVEEYLAMYSAGFAPSSGVSRSVWENRRRERLKQGNIRVAVVAMEVEELSPTEKTVTFTQSYQSDTFRDRVRKTLRMVWEDDAWKIAAETVVRQLPW